MSLTGGAGDSVTGVMAALIRNSKPQAAESMGVKGEREQTPSLNLPAGHCSLPPHAVCPIDAATLKTHMLEAAGTHNNAQSDHSLHLHSTDSFYPYTHSHTMVASTMQGDSQLVGSSQGEVPCSGTPEHSNKQPSGYKSTPCPSREYLIGVQIQNFQFGQVFQTTQFMDSETKV